MPRYTFKLSSLLWALMASSALWAAGRWVSEELCIRANQDRLFLHGPPLLDRVLNDGQGEYHVCVFAGAIVVTDRLYGERLVEQLPFGHRARLILRQPNLVQIELETADGNTGYAHYQVTPERVELVYQSAPLGPLVPLHGLRRYEPGTCACCPGEGDWEWSRY